ncbi:hypothetical protein AB0N87_41945 [Streptomyces sp. NPDC093228]|uniref:hypothetical protein n=1 Tax=Streptomyces sp. NPDC093228 TaxID=3155070 RepID=UPI00343A79B2
MTAAHAHEIWAQEAYQRLAEVARTYHAVITYKELATKIQHDSQIHTSVLLHNWIGRVLGVVVREAHRRGDPPLTALVVHTEDGMVGEGYREALTTAGQVPVEEPLEREHHAASARLDCYRRFAADLPADGGVRPRPETGSHPRAATPPDLAGRLPQLRHLLRPAPHHRHLRRLQLTKPPRDGHEELFSSLAP